LFLSNFLLQNARRLNANRISAGFFALPAQRSFPFSFASFQNFQRGIIRAVTNGGKMRRTDLTPPAAVANTGGYSPAGIGVFRFTSAA
jgi:hypothetical protein